MEPLGRMYLADRHNAESSAHRTERRGCAQLATRVPMADSPSGGSGRLQARYGLQVSGFQDLRVHPVRPWAVSEGREKARKNRETKEEPTISLIIKDGLWKPTMSIKTNDLASYATILLKPNELSYYS